MYSAQTTSCKDPDAGEMGKNHRASDGGPAIELSSTDTLSPLRLMSFQYVTGTFYQATYVSKISPRDLSCIRLASRRGELN